MAEQRITIDIVAPPERVFGLWMDLDRMTEWVGGVTRVTDVTGPIDLAGTRYTVWFGPMKSRTEILEVERPHHVRTRFGNLILKGESDVRFEPTPHGTRLTLMLWTHGVISAIFGRLFAAGSYEGSFKGELETFRTIAEREQVASATAPTSREAVDPEPPAQQAEARGH
jgi:uncharacterized protein YndB with AHSA1/START domain